MTKQVVIALLAVGLVASASAETETAAKAGKEEGEASTVKAAQPAKPAKSSKPAKQPASKTRETPFGPVEETTAAGGALPDTELSSDPSVSAEAKGDLVIFRRKTPFGNQVWRKKKSELTADERSILARGRTSADGPQPAKSEGAAKQASKPRASGKQ